MHRLRPKVQRGVEGLPELQPAGTAVEHQQPVAAVGDIAGARHQMGAAGRFVATAASRDVGRGRNVGLVVGQLARNPRRRIARGRVIRDTGRRDALIAQGRSFPQRARAGARRRPVLGRTA